MQSVLGRFHHSSYDALRRLNDRGYLQIEQWTKTTTSHGKRTGHLLTWSYGISQYATEADARSAVNDIMPQMLVMSAGGSYGRGVALSQGESAYLYMTFGERTITGEILCSAKTRDAKAYKATLLRYCRAHVTALMPTLSAAAIPTPTATATATSTQTPTSTNTPTATNTPVPTNTPAPTDTPTWTPVPVYYPPPATAKATWTPVPVYYPPPTSGGGCIPQEGDRDNDDKRLPAASWEHDGCP